MTRDDRYSAAIRAAITAQGTTHTDVAMAAKIPWNAWTRRMNGPTKWRAHELQAIAHALNVPVAQLLGEESA